MKKFLLLSIISLTLILPISALAYSESAGPGDLRATVYPQNPSISQKTNISLASYSLNLDACSIIWRQNGTTIEEGIGQKSFSFTTGTLGQTVSISATLTCPNHDKITKDLTFQTNDVEFLVVADTYVPPFYRGGSRVSTKSTVKITALPQAFDSTGHLIKSENLIYHWTKNGKAMPISSGYGKNTLTVQANELPGSTNYALEILSTIGEVKVNKSITVSVENPQIIIYENKPLLGVQYQKAQGKLLNLAENETTLTAELFFFSNLDLVNGNIGLNWSMNNKKISPGIDNRSLTLRQGAGQAGEATIRLEAVNSTNIFSTAQKEMKVNFGQKSLFGF